MPQKANRGRCPALKVFTIQSSNRSLTPTITDCHFLPPGVEKDSEVTLGFNGKEFHELLVTLVMGKPRRVAVHTEYLPPVMRQLQLFVALKLTLTTFFLAGLLLERMKEPDSTSAFLTTKVDSISKW